jgi:hypothetical protein
MELSVMKQFYRYHWLPVALVCLMISSCEPGGGDTAPAFLSVDPTALDFQAEEDTETLLLRNTGGKVADFTISVTGESGGFTWLEVSPDSGVMQPSDVKIITVKIAERQNLIPDSYDGKITIQGTGLEPIVVPVSMIVGQPELEVEPSEELDFGEATVSRKLIIKNTGAGKLAYKVQLPGVWLSTDGATQKEITSNEPQTMNLAVDRSQIPWYGDGTDDIIITSNGLDGGSHSSTAILTVKVFVDPSCEVDANCIKEGFFCDLSSGEGICTARKENGQECATSEDCKSGFCADSVCCDGACANPCQACNLAGTAGTCQPREDGAACDDDQYCTETTTCSAGECGSGTDRDCSKYTTDCSDGVCDEELNQCSAGGTDGKWCVIDGLADKCIPAGQWHSELTCLQCQPEKNPLDWSLVPGTCLIDSTCYPAGATLPGTCQICDTAFPRTPSKAMDGTACPDDGIPCTKDTCEEGQCKHVNMTTGSCDDSNPCTKDDQCSEGGCAGEYYSCDDGLDCTNDMCDGEGSCLAEIVASACLIDGACLAGNVEKPSSFGCLACKPVQSQEEWTTVDNATACSDDNACTLLDHCVDGACVGDSVDCNDNLDCTEDSCNSESGDCANIRNPNWCIINNACQLVDVHPPGPDSGCLVCDPYDDPDQWTTINEGLPCNDELECTDAPVCLAGICLQQGPVCDDNNPCTVDGCDANGLCTSKNLDDGSECLTDDNDCTSDICQVGACIHPPLDGMCAIGDGCFANNESHPDHSCAACKVSQSQTEWTPINDGLDCSDGLFCTEDDVCQTGSCNGPPRDCGATGCKDALCSEELDKCAYSNLEDGLICDDGDACTSGDECLDGDCLGIAKECGAAAGDNPCLQGICDPDSQPLAGECVAVNKQEGTLCNDDKFCTENDICVAGTCLGDARICPAPDCTKTTCIEATDECLVEADPTLDGQDCDDGDQCTKNTTCSVDGVCGSGDSTTPEECTALLGIENPCQTAVCIPGDGCQMALKLDGSDCTLDNSTTAECSSGQCSVVECAIGWGDCNETDTDGCEHDVLADDNNCGECNTECINEEFCEGGWCVFDCADLTFCMGECVDITAHAVHCDGCGNTCEVDDPGMQGVCVNSTCYDTNCPSNHWNVDLKTATGCEYPCTLSNNGKEICDGIDNDCDLEIDEGFTVWNDPNNCGECGHVCGPFPHTLFDICAGGECTIGSCLPGWADEDNDPFTGCEEYTLEKHIYVDSFNLGDPFQNGTELHPFEDLDEALAVCEAYEIIHVKNGVYSAPYTVAVEGVTIIGESLPGVLISTVGAATGFNVTANKVTLQSLTITKGIKGITFSNVSGGAVREVNLMGIQYVNYPNWGIRIVNSSDIEITDTAINEIGFENKPGSCGACARITYGIEAISTSGIAISGVSISGIFSQGAAYNVPDHPGNAAGIRFESSTNITIQDSGIDTVHAGINKNGADCDNFNCNIGFSASGLSFVSSVNATVSNSVIYDIAGGLSAPSVGGNGLGSCLDVAGSSAAISVDTMTCIGSEVPNQAGIRVYSNVAGPLYCSNSIIADMSNRCVWNGGNNSSSYLSVSYSNLNNCGPGVSYNSKVDNNVFTITPGFVDAADHNFHLTNNSPCIDTGKPGDDYCAEPEPNGCRINMGAYGGTSEATPINDSQHCACE